MLSTGAEIADEDDSDNLRKALTFMGTAEFLPVIDLIDSMDSMDSTGFHQDGSTPAALHIAVGPLPRVSWSMRRMATWQLLQWPCSTFCGVYILGWKVWLNETLKDTERHWKYRQHVYIPHILAWLKNRPTDVDTPGPLDGIKWCILWMAWAAVNWSLTVSCCTQDSKILEELGASGELEATHMFAVFCSCYPGGFLCCTL